MDPAGTQQADTHQKQSELGPTEVREERDNKPTEAREDHDTAGMPHLEKITPPAPETAAEDQLAKHEAATKTKEEPPTKTHEYEGDATPDELAAYNSSLRHAPVDHPLFTSTKFSFPCPVQLQRVGTSEVALTPGPCVCSVLLPHLYGSVDVLVGRQSRGKGKVVEYHHRGHSRTATVGLVRFKLNAGQHIKETGYVVVDNDTMIGHLVPWYTKSRKSLRAR
jgi:hypothetical protein